MTVESLELGSCFVLASPKMESSKSPCMVPVLKHGFVHLREPLDEGSPEPVSRCGPRSPSAPPRPVLEEEELAFSRYVATFHFSRGTPTESGSGGSTCCSPTWCPKTPTGLCSSPKGSSPKTPTRAKETLLQLATSPDTCPNMSLEEVCRDLRAADVIGPQDAAESAGEVTGVVDGAVAKEDEVATPGSFRLRADAPAFVPSSPGFSLPGPLLSPVPSPPMSPAPSPAFAGQWVPAPPPDAPTGFPTLPAPITEVCHDPLGFGDECAGSLGCPGDEAMCATPPLEGASPVGPMGKLECQAAGRKLARALLGEGKAGKAAPPREDEQAEQASQASHDSSSTTAPPSAAEGPDALDAERAGGARAEARRQSNARRSPLNPAPAAQATKGSRSSRGPQQQPQPPQEQEQRGAAAEHSGGGDGSAGGGKHRKQQQQQWRSGGEAHGGGRKKFSGGGAGAGRAHNTAQLIWRPKVEGTKA